MKKIAFVSASGGHYDELRLIMHNMRDYKQFLVVGGMVSDENLGCHKYNIFDYGSVKLSVKMLKFVITALQNIYIFFLERPNVLITTGPSTGLIMALLVRLFKGKVIYIECSAQVFTPSLSGRFFYFISNSFFVQWKELLKYYPDAIYKGHLLS